MRSFTAAFVPALLVTVTPLVALAQSAMDPEVVRECIRVHDSSRLLWNDGHWLEAREAMNGCVDARCPAAIGSECRAWQDELTRVMPTVSIIVQRAAGDDESGRATGEVDGQELSAIEPFGRIEVNPGPHVVRVRLPGYNPVEQSFVAPPKKKNIVVVLRFKDRPASRVVVDTFFRPVPRATYWLASGALTAFAGSGILLWSALAERATAEKTCAPECGTGTILSIKAKTIAADAVGIAGLTLGGFALASYVSRPAVRTPGPNALLGFYGVRGGAVLQVAGGF